MSNLEAHAEREMRRAGLYEKDADYGGMIPDAVMALVRAHAAQGHSGGSHSLVMAIFNRVANFKTLTPITSAPDEWIDRSEMSGEPMWQNARQSSVFSRDGGKTWYDLDAPPCICDHAQAHHRATWVKGREVQSCTKNECDCEDYAESAGRGGMVR